MDFLSKSSNSFRLMERSMEFLWTKQAAILDNIANVETPNYKTKVVTFEESLREKLEAARNSATPRQSIRELLEDEEVDVFEARESTRMDENGVNITEQAVELARNALQLQYVMQGISSDLATLGVAIRGQ